MISLSEIITSAGFDIENDIDDMQTIKAILQSETEELIEVIDCNIDYIENKAEYDRDAELEVQAYRCEP